MIALSRTRVHNAAKILVYPPTAHRRRYEYAIASTRKSARGGLETFDEWPIRFSDIPERTKRAVRRVWTVKQIALVFGNEIWLRDVAP